MDILTFNLCLGIFNVVLLLAIRFFNRKFFFFLASFSFLAIILFFLLISGGTNIHSMFHQMSLACYAIFLHGGIFLIASSFMLKKNHKNLSKVLLATFLVLELVALDAFVIEPNWLETTHYIIESEKLDREISIAVMSDFQTDKIGSYEHDVLEKIMDAKPDLILLPGDYIQVQNPTERKKVIEEFRKELKKVNFKAPMGVYAVGGNAEHSNWTEIFTGLPIKTIQWKQTIALKELNLTGLNLSESGNPNIKVGNPNSAKFHIVFGHVPDFALGKTEADLLVAGHTHGGQVRIPFFGAPITLSYIPRDWASGLTELSWDKSLIVSRGIGMERGNAPRLRFLCRPELAIIHLKPKKP